MAWLSEGGPGKVPTGLASGQLDSAVGSSKGCRVPGRASPLSGHHGPRPRAAREPTPPSLMGRKGPGKTLAGASVLTVKAVRQTDTSTH